MTTGTPRNQAHPASGTEAATSAAFASGTAEQPEHDAPPRTTPSLPSLPSLPLPGRPFGVDPKRLLWYGGLAALATVGVLEWPVAAVVGVGSYVAERMARDDAARAAREPS